MRLRPAIRNRRPGQKVRMLLCFLHCVWCYTSASLQGASITLIRDIKKHQHCLQDLCFDGLNCFL